MCVVCTEHHVVDMSQVDDLELWLQAMEDHEEKAEEEEEDEEEKKSLLDVRKYCTLICRHNIIQPLCFSL